MVTEQIYKIRVFNSVEDPFIDYKAEMYVVRLISSFLDKNYKTEKCLFSIKTLVEAKLFIPYVLLTFYIYTLVLTLQLVDLFAAVSVPPRSTILIFEYRIFLSFAFDCGVHASYPSYWYC